MSMGLRPFGRTGLMISPFTLGSMEFGSKVDATDASRLLDRAIEAGVIALDTANVYTSGRSEEIVGRLITGRRDRFILATKFSVPTDSQDPNSGGTSRRTPARRACAGSTPTTSMSFTFTGRRLRPLSMRRCGHWMTWSIRARFDTSAHRERPAGS
jgi:aryl-alcohol dehydrogenase-like predicted oxidoreductase